MIDRVAAVLGGRLDHRSKAPIAVALSGGGDSVALLALTLDWARPYGRPVLALSVDHGLNPDSAAWTRYAAETAARLGAAHRALAWTGAKPATGLPAAARAARHALLAQAARAEGAGVILLGHTADDVAEGWAMRAEGSSLGALRAWSPSPAWPAGREVMLLRPMLGASRAELRDFLTGRGLDWIEDPANADPRFARARARQRLSAGDLTPAKARPEIAPGRDDRVKSLATACAEDGAGGLVIARETLRNSEPGALRAFLSAALVCASGGARPPRGPRLDALLARLAAEDAFTATLAGARVEADNARLRILRDAGEAARGGLAPVTLAPRIASVWDGRFEIVADHACEVRPLKGLAARLDAADRAALRALPAAARPGLPVLVRDDQARPVLAARGAWVRALALSRLFRACGVIAHERENGVSAHSVLRLVSLCSEPETPPVAGEQRSRS
nr:tRNA lysidine(34) synthetase TilS [Caulobacter sp. 17J80-11]